MSLAPVKRARQVRIVSRIAMEDSGLRIANDFQPCNSLNGRHCRKSSFKSALLEGNVRVHPWSAHAEARNRHRCVRVRWN